VELFFKALKQTAKIKTFVGTSANAVRTQVWTALIAMLVLKYLQLKSTFSWSLSTLAALLRQQLFFYRDLWAWLNDPFQAPPALGVAMIALFHQLEEGVGLFGLEIQVAELVDKCSAEHLSTNVKLPKMWS
jgi:hypothetical protein